MKYLLAMALGLFSTVSPELQAHPHSLMAPFLIQEEPACPEGDSSCLILEEKQTFDLADWGALDFLEIAEDSRCPLDAVCIWAGRVRVVMKHQNLVRSEKFEMGLGGTLQAEWIDEVTGLKVKLEQVWPEKLLSAPQDQPYRIKLKLEAAPKEIPDSNDNPVQDDGILEEESEVISTAL